PAGAGPDPTFVIPFASDAPPALRRARVEHARGIYVPAYLYSAAARTSFTAEIGEHYTEKRTEIVEDAEGNQKTETHAITRTEYRPLAGTHVGYVTDVVVSASA